MQRLRNRTAARLLALLLLSTVTAGPLAASELSPKYYWTPEGMATYGDPDLGGGGISLRGLHYVLMLRVLGIGSWPTLLLIPMSHATWERPSGRH
jgi:hypothetical protein